MTSFNRIFAVFLVAALCTVFTPAGKAEEQYAQQSYGAKVGQKAARAVANLVTAPLEVPKNMINVTNQSNVFYGIIGGLFKGLVHTAGRLGVAAADLITIPLPTKPIAHPVYIWQDFDVDTTYGDTFRLDPSQQAAQPQTAIPPAAPPAKPVMTLPAAEPNYSNQYDQDTNRKIDTLFKQKMMK